MKNFYYVLIVHLYELMKIVKTNFIISNYKEVIVYLQKCQSVLKMC